MEGTKKQVFEYSKEELIKMIIPREILLEAFRNNQHLTVLGEMIYSSTKEIDGEIWKEHKTINNLFASNYGRIKFNGEIIPQKEEDGEKALETGHIGWLVPTKTIAWYKYVYQIVCDIWHGQNPGTKGNYWHRHHLSNDGYDNRPQNLIWIEPKLHSEIHKIEKELQNPNSNKDNSD